MPRPAPGRPRPVLDHPVPAPPVPTVVRPLLRTQARLPALALRHPDVRLDRQLLPRGVPPAPRQLDLRDSAGALHQVVRPSAPPPGPAAGGSAVALIGREHAAPRPQ